MTEPRRSTRWGWIRAGVSGLAVGLILILSGDGARSAVVTGIDPLEILKLQVRPNVILMLDSSGSMSEPTNAVNDVPDLESGDHPASKLNQAKQVLLAFISANQTKVSFQFGTYQQPATTLANGNRFIWTTTDANAATLQINPANSGNASGAATQIARDNGGVNDIFDGFGVKHFKLYTGKFGTGATLLNGRTFYTLVDGTDCGQAKSIAGATTNPPTISIQEVLSCATLTPTVRPKVTFTFAGATNWNGSTGANTCPGFLPRTSLVDCQTQNQLDATPPGVPIRQFLANELLLDASGNIQGYVESAAGAVTTQPAVGGIRASGFTPIANVLINLKSIFSGNFYNPLAGNIYNLGFATPAFPYNVPAITSQVNATLRQRTFAIVVTDGDDTCATTTTTGSGVNLALRAAHQAEVLYKRIAPADPASGVPSFLIAFGSGASAVNSNYIAWGGSGMKSTGQGGTIPLSGAFGAAATRWNRVPTAAERTNCITCQDAFIATTTAALSAALQSVIDQSVGQGEFSDAQSIIGTVFELTIDVPTTPAVESPLDPANRYGQRVNILYQPTFELPGWQGHLYGFRNDGTFQSVGAVNSTGQFDAGQTLNDQVSLPMQTATRAGRPVDNFTFAELHAGTNVDTIYGSNALIKRRIFTSNGNGRFVRTANGNSGAGPGFDSSQPTGRNVVALWPPDQTGLTSGIAPIDPAAPGVGPLDVALGVSTLTFAQAQAFGACKASTDVGSGPAPALCVALDLPTAKREAREIIVAWTAGATLNLGNDGLPTRDATSSELLYQDRGWLLGDPTLAAPAVSTPPLRSAPQTHIQEFILYRDGRRDSSGHSVTPTETSLGFGLRNPDIDDTNFLTEPAVKPVMTVVFLAANDGVHAFRAGPQCATNGCEQGSEELWNYIPFDQLGKLAGLVGGQKASPHTYIAASSLRIADIFVPDADGYTFPTSLGVNFTGRWRRALYFGRGSGGSYYTALDITSPGVFTQNALRTDPPWVMWSRGNPDTVDGTPAGTVVRAADTAAYATMGQTWSVPAVGNVDPSLPSEWRLFVGSGYGDDATTNGRTFYQLDATTGDVVSSFDVGNGLTTYVANNALVAGPTAYNSRQLDPPFTATPSPQDQVTRVFFPDLQGRIWKVTVGGAPAQGLFFDGGPSQPFANPVSLLKINGSAYVYANSGNDTRVPDAAGPFKLFGLQDLGGDTAVTAGIPASAGFPINLPGTPPTNILFRGTTQPATAFNASSQPRVFFEGTRFNPAGAASCQSSFDTILFAVRGITGGAAYDFTGDGVADMYTVFTQTKDMGIQVAGGSLYRSASGSLGAAPSPTPDPNPTPTPAPPQPAFVSTIAQRSGSPVCRTP